MCGIVGYIGSRQAQELIVEGLRKLEYRGYDSAGIAVYNGERILVQKAKGRLSHTEEKLKKDELPGQLGIGHTRWATHGKPSDENAHPHIDNYGRFAVIHNGIIENYIELKEQLIQKGWRFVSETDTEVVSNLLADLWDGDLVSTVQKMVKQLKGAYALGVICSEDPSKLIAVRSASPLIVGVGKGENFFASDIAAVLEHTRNIYILEDGEMAVIQNDNVELMKLDGTPVKRDIFKVDWDLATAEKEGYDHFMLKEIHEQPRAIRDTMSSRIQEGRVDLSRELALTPAQIKQIEKIQFVACGTAYHAGLVGKYVLESLVRIPVEVDIASEYRYRNPIVDDRTLVVVVSQSGETADTLAALREAKKNHARILGITNVVGSSVAREADDVIVTWAGPEVAVASTKAYTSQLVAIYLLALYFAQIRAESDTTDLVSTLLELPAKAEETLKLKSDMEQLAKRIVEHRSLFFLGRGLDFAVALEGSLKLKEISYIHSEAYAAGELKHGTLALIEENTPVIALATQESVFDKMASNIQEVRARGAYVWGFTMPNEYDLDPFVQESIIIPKTLDLFSPLLCVIPLQLLAYYACVSLGYDVDKPRNLAKSVTVE